MIYYRRYVGDYLRKTSRLSLLEHGAYSVMLDHYYTDETPLPLDKGEIYTMVRAMTPADRKAVDKVLSKYFQKHADGYHNERADEEIAVAQQARENGKKSGGRPPKNKTETITGCETGSETGNETECETTSGAETEAGSVHPLAVNHLAFQPSSLPTNQPPAASPADSPPLNRAAAIAVLLRNLEKARGKAPKVTSIDPRVQAWAEAGVTDDQLREAHALAVGDREANGENAPINAGFLDVFVTKVRNPGNGKSRLNGASAKPWFVDTWSALEIKAAELGMQQADDEAPPYFRARVLKAAGITDEQVRKAEADFR